MILTPHILAGAVIGAKTQNLGLIIILSFLIHFIMDKIPHYDYYDYYVGGIREFKKTKNYKKLFIDFVKIGMEGLIGLLIVFIILWQKEILNSEYLPFILLGIIISLLPDISLATVHIFASKNFAEKYYIFHEKYLHSKKQKEGEITFLGIATQLAVIIISCAFLLNL